MGNNLDKNITETRNIEYKKDLTICESCKNKYYFYGNEYIDSITHNCINCLIKSNYCFNCSESKNNNCFIDLFDKRIFFCKKCFNIDLILLAYDTVKNHSLNKRRDENLIKINLEFDKLNFKKYLKKIIDEFNKDINEKQTIFMSLKKDNNSLISMLPQELIFEIIKHYTLIQINLDLKKI